MKKTYIKPESVVVAINAKAHLMVNSIPQSLISADPSDSGASDIDKPILSREVIIEESTISSRDAWEEW